MLSFGEYTHGAMVSEVKVSGSTKQSGVSIPTVDHLSYIAFHLTAVHIHFGTHHL